MIIQCANCGYPIDIPDDFGGVSICGDCYLTFTSSNSDMTIEDLLNWGDTDDNRDREWFNNAMKG